MRRRCVGRPRCGSETRPRSHVEPHVAVVGGERPLADEHGQPGRLHLLQPLAPAARVVEEAVLRPNVEPRLVDVGVEGDAAAARHVVAPRVEAEGVLDHKEPPRRRRAHRPVAVPVEGFQHVERRELPRLVESLDAEHRRVVAQRRRDVLYIDGRALRELRRIAPNCDGRIARKNCAEEVRSASPAARRQRCGCCPTRSTSTSSSAGRRCPATPRSGTASAQTTGRRAATSRSPPARCCRSRSESAARLRASERARDGERVGKYPIARQARERGVRARGRRAAGAHRGGR